MYEPTDEAPEAPGAAQAVSGGLRAYVPPDELFYHDGSWYLYKPRPIELPKFEFSHLAAELERLQLVRELQWVAGLTLNAPLPMTIVTGC